MIGPGLLSPLLALCCLLIALFYLFRLVRGRRWLPHFDAENEGGHGIMAVGMMFMLAPVNILTPDLIRWNIVLFVVATLWWTARLLMHKPVLALLAGRSDIPSPAQSDALHILMHGGMCFMFLLMSSMAFSMTLPAIYVTCSLFLAFVFLTVFYGREVARDGRSLTKNWFRLGANVAHLLTSGIMCWMFLEMLTMVLRMSP